MKVKLTCLTRDINLPGGLRTSSVIGTCDSLPKRGEGFAIWADPLEAGDIRCICTSHIDDIDIEDGIYTIVTENKSVYTVEILEV